MGLIFNNILKLKEQEARHKLVLLPLATNPKSTFYIFQGIDRVF